MSANKLDLRAILAVLVALIMCGTSVRAGDILVYNGEGGLTVPFNNFGSATGKTVQILQALPQDLLPFDCVVLPLNGWFGGPPLFSAATLEALNGYVNGGGRIIAQAEWYPYAGVAIAVMNGLATNLGADLFVVPDAIDAGFHTTNNIDPSPFTVGVNSIRYAFTSGVSVLVGPHAHSLVRTIDGTTFIGVDKIGSGVFVLSGDGNVFSDQNDTGYIVEDNGTLAANICDQASFAIEVTIDIKPGSSPNSINPFSSGVLPVAILTTDVFDALQVDITTMVFGPDGAGIPHQQGHVEDVDDDGDLDLIAFFRTQQTGIACGDTEATLGGETFAGDPVSGSDTINTVGKSCE